MTAVTLPAPPDRLGLVDETLRAAVLAALEGPSPAKEAREWAEKLRRFVGVYRQTLARVAADRFGAEASAMTAWMFAVMMAAARTPARSGDAPLDLQFLNAALGLACVINNAGTGQKLQNALALVDRWHAQATAQPLPMATPQLAFEPGRWRAEAQQPLRIVVFCPNPYSLGTLAVMGLLEALHVPIAGVVVRGFSAGRFAQEFRRDGARLFQKIWRKLILRTNENPDAIDISLKQLADEFAGSRNHAARWCKQAGIPVATVNDLNDPSLRDWLRALKPDVGLFTGGGLVGTRTQSAFRIGIVNPHMGHLPCYRGMDVVQWPVLERHGLNVGSTAHLMDSGLDTGATLQHLRVTPTAYRSVGALRNAVSALMPLLLVDTALGLGSGRLTPIPQDRVEPLFYYMEPELLARVEALLARGAGETGGCPETGLFRQLVSDIRPAVAGQSHRGR